MLKNLWAPVVMAGMAGCSSNDASKGDSGLLHYECNNPTLPGRGVKMTNDGEFVHYVASDRGVVLAEGNIRIGNSSGIEQTRENLTELVCDDTAAGDSVRKLIRKFGGEMAEADPVP